MKSKFIEKLFNIVIQRYKMILYKICSFHIQLKTIKLVSQISILFITYLSFSVRSKFI